MEKLDMLQAIFGKVNDFGWCGLERIQTDTGKQFTPNTFQEGLYVRGVQLTSTAPNHQETNGKLKERWREI